MHVVLQARATLLIATAVFVAWRLWMWRRRPGDWRRELFVVALFVWCLVIVRYTFFPMRIFFYDWHGRFSLRPFASITQLVRDVHPDIARYNIVGNLLLFVPLGALLAALFPRLRRPWPLLWRAAVVSASIEATQLVTRTRSVDVDDIILNTAGAGIGLVLFWMAQLTVGRSTWGREWLERVGSGARGEPLLGAVVPVLVTMVIAVPVMLTTILDGTLTSGDIEAQVAAAYPDGNVVVRAASGEYTMLVAGDASGEQIRLFTYEKILPGRYTPWIIADPIDRGPASTYAYSITDFNVERREIPQVLVWGTNHVGAVTAEVTGNGVNETLDLQDGDVFAVGFPFDVLELAPGDVLDSFVFTFRDAGGNDVSDAFSDRKQ